jgi:predicted dehydrogenase
LLWRFDNKQAGSGALGDEGAVQGFRRILVTEPAHHAYVEGWWPPGHIIGYEHTFTHTVYDSLLALAARKGVKPDFEDGVRNQMVLEAIERAARTRRWVTV